MTSRCFFGSLGRRYSMVPAGVPQERLVKVKVNGQELQVPDSATIMQASQLAGVDIPRFCYHERLGIAGNCRMCLVQVNDGPKLVASCAAPVAPDMRIATESPAVKKAREGVMEFLLANHPLDCPICDQGGECDLQDQAMAFGSDRSRFSLDRQSKRAVEDKNFGPLVKTSMNRCIHCTRCVRFANEVAGVQELGTTGRGNEMQISTYVERMLDSPLSGNIIDLCPVGALTSKPYAFTARPWELRRTDSIDVMDGVGANIKVDSRGFEVMRILPRLHEQVNEEWLADRSRFAYDGLRQQRLVQPLWREGADLVPVSWEDALVMLADRISRTPTMSIVAGRFADVHTLGALRMLFDQSPGTNFIVDGCTGWLPAEISEGLRLTGGLAGIEEADNILLIGCNPLLEAPLLNARIRKTWLRRDLLVGVIGDGTMKLTYDYVHLGEDYRAIEKCLGAEHSPFRGRVQEERRTLIIIGQDALFRHPDQQATLAALQSLLSRHPHATLGMLATTASVTGALLCGYRPQAIPSTSRLVYLLNADDFDRTAIPEDAFIIYQGHHGDRGAALASLVLPGAAYTEKDALYVNMEGRPQMTRRAVPPPGEARPDWAIVRALSEFLGRTLPFDDVNGLQEQLSRMCPVLATLDRPPISSGLREALLGATLSPVPPSSVPSTPYAILHRDYDYYLNDCISRHSPTMAQCSLAFTTRRNHEQGRSANQLASNAIA